MIISVDVYTKDIDEALAVYKAAAEGGCHSVALNVSEDYETKEIEAFNLMFETDHKSPILDLLDKPGVFEKDLDDLD